MNDEPVEASTSTLNPSTSENRLSWSRQRSLSLPSFNGTSAWFPSPSSAFRTPPVNEAEILRDLISRERIKRDAKLSKRRSVSQLLEAKRIAAAAADSPRLPAVMDAQEEQQQQSASTSGTTPPHSPSSQSHSDQSTPVPTPTASAITLQGFTAVHGGQEGSSERPGPPSRPPSSYASFLPDLDSPKTDVAKRLSLSSSRRNSRHSIHSNASTPFSAPSTPLEEVTALDIDQQQLILDTAASEAVIIRDFAFSATDPRHIGQPGVASSTDSVSSVSDTSSRVAVGGVSIPEGVFEDSSSESGVGGPPSSHGGGGFSWDFMPPHQQSQTSQSGLLLSPTADVTFVSPRDSDFGDDDFESDGDVSTERAEDLDPADLIPEGGALYVAAYAFVPEAAQEMSLRVGEVVRVLERLCEGWVICVRQQLAEGNGVSWVDARGGETGLVPETYLQRHDLVSPDLSSLSLEKSRSKSPTTEPTS